MATPKIKLYTNHNCPWAHRVHIALAELNLPYEEEIIDLTVPRSAEYLKVNPRGLVPTLSYNGEIIPESAIVAQFLADAHPSSDLLPASNAEGGALRRARISFFVDTFVGKFIPVWNKAWLAGGEGDLDAVRTQLEEVVAKELEPLLADAAPFFGASKKLTFAEVLTGSFVIRLLSFPKHGVVPENFIAGLPDKTPNFYKWAQAVAKHPSVTNIYEEKTRAEYAKAKVAQLKAAKKN